MVLRAALALLLLCLSWPLLPVAAVALDKNDPRYVQTECARAWNRCWDGCSGKSSSCYKGCNDRYDICLKIEIEAAPTYTPDTGGTTPRPQKGLGGTFGGSTLPGATAKP